MTCRRRRGFGRRGRRLSRGERRPRSVVDWHQPFIDADEADHAPFFRLFLGGPLAATSTEDRRKGFRQRLAAHGIAPAAEVYGDSFSYKEGNRLAYKPVHLKPMTVESFEPKVRTY